jgi:hypothetical protein
MISFFKNSGPHYTKLRAVLIIAIATLLVSGSASAFLLFFHFQHYLHGKSDLYHIKSIVQTGPIYEQLPTVAIAEMLELSADKPTNIYDFSVSEAKRKLRQTHLFKEMVIKKMVPSTLYIDYSLKQPIATLGEMTNTSVDEEGSLFPTLPYFTPKKLPEIFLNVPFPKQLWGKCIEKKKMEIICNILSHLKAFSVLRIDLAAMDDPSLGRQEIVVMVRSGRAIRTLRLNPSDYENELKSYIALEKTVLLGADKSHIIDLRIPMVGYIKEVGL